jgi:WD40 repeat protein
MVSSVSPTFPVQPNVAPRVFISYARADGEAFADSLRQRLQAANVPLWQDRIGMEGGKDWWLQITEAIDASDFMVLVMTPRAVASPIVRKEWRYARQQGVCVYPVKADTTLDFATLPRWMRDSHFYDLDREWDKFLIDLGQVCETVRVPFLVQDMPEDYVPRAALYDSVIDVLLDDSEEEPRAVNIALRGAGGYGKTTLARAVCHDERVQQAFDDGVLWVTLGEHPGDLTSRVVDLIEVLSGERPGFSTVEAAAARLVELLADRDLLIVIDDVWNAVHLRPFLQGGTRCARIITTRNSDTLPLNVVKIDVDAMTTSEAVTLLGNGVQYAGYERDMAALAKRLGEWVLLIKLANGVLRRRTESGGSMREAIDYVNKALDKRGLRAFDARDAVDRGHAVAKALKVSFDLLLADEYTRMTELAIFPEDVEIPLVTVQTLWGATGGLDDLDTEDLCGRLFGMSLLLTFDLSTGRIRLHDIIRTYLREEVGGNLPALNATFLDAFSNTYKLAKWSELPKSEVYLWDALFYHMRAAGQKDRMVATICDLEYLIAKLSIRDAYSVETDIDTVVMFSDEMDGAINVATFARDFSRMTHLLKKTDSKNDMRAIILSRLQHIGEYAELLEPLRAKLTAPYILPDRTLPDLPHPALVRTLSGHNGRVMSLSIHRSGRVVVSASDDSTLKLWDTDTWTERRTLRGHTGAVNVCVFAGDRVVSGSSDGTVRLWDADSGECIHIMQGHEKKVRGLATTSDGLRALSTSEGGTLIVWDLTTGEQIRRQTRAHSKPIWTVVLAPDDAHYATGSGDGTIRLWNTESGELLRTIEAHKGGVQDILFSGDGRILSCGEDHLIRVWDEKTGEQIAVLEGHRAWVRQLALRGYLLSSADDGTLRVWDMDTYTQIEALTGHAGWIRCCATFGGLALSGSDDMTIKVWDLDAIHMISGVLKQFSGSPTGDLTQDKDDRAGARGYSRCGISTDGKRAFAAAYTGLVNVIDMETGAEIRALPGHSRGVGNCAMSPDGRWAVSAADSNTLKVWDVDTGKEVRTLGGHGGWVRGCAVSHDGSFLVSASTDKTLKIWDAQTGERRHILKGHYGWVLNCAISPDDTFIVSASKDTFLMVWDVATGEQIATLSGHAREIRDVAISPRGDAIVSVSEDAQVRVWSTRDSAGNLDFREAFILSGHATEVRGCTFSPDGSLILTTCADGTIKVWDVAKRVCIATYAVEGRLNHVAMHPDGERILATGGNGIYFLRLHR